MSFIIEPHGRLDEAIRRAVHIEVTRAVADLTLPPERLHQGVHEARKSFKRLRALYRLLAAADPDAAAREIVRFRDISASLAEARDAAAQVEAFNRLQAAFPVETAGGALTPVEDFLLRRREAATHADSGLAGHVDSAVAACREAYAAMDAFSLPQKRRACESLIADGMTGTLRKARRALRSARRNQSAEAFHTLRKRVKDHLYHLGLLRLIWPKPGSLRRAAFDDLGERLGDLNDCDVLSATLLSEAPALAESQAGELALELLARQAAALRQRVLAEGVWLLSARPASSRKKLARRLKKARRASRVAMP